MNESFKSLSDPTRRKILELLAIKDMTAGEIAARFEMTKPSISHHLNQLKFSGLVLSEKQGQNVLYSLNTTLFQEVSKWFFDFMKKGEEK